MSERSCEKCKFWNRENESSGWESSGIGFHLCTAVRERWEIQDEAVRDMNRNERDDEAYYAARKNALRASRAYVQDGSEYRAELLTGPDFFCALFEPSA